MEILTRVEELLLLVVWKLQGEAYGLGIRSELSRLTDSEMSVGAVYTPLKRLEQKGLLQSWDSEPIEERGGRSKRFYRLTEQGVRALNHVHSVTRAAWKDVPETALGLSLKRTGPAS